MEDYIGHLVSLVKGTTDITTQISSRYLLEKELQVQLEKSERARYFYESIESKLHFPIAQKIRESLVIGKAKVRSDLNDDQLNFISNSIYIDNLTEILEYRSAFLNNRFFYEISSNNIKKRTNDSIVYNHENKCFGEVLAMLTIDGQLYFLIDEKFSKIKDSNCKRIHFLKITHNSKLNLITPASISHKYAFVEFSNTIAAAKFPNFYERN